MDRRDFLTLRKKTTPLASPESPKRILGITSGLAPYSGSWTTREVVHLLKRTMFGAKKADVDYFKSISVTQAVNELLNPSATPPAPPLKHYDNSGTPSTDPDYAIPQGSTWVNTVSLDGGVNFKRMQSLKAWWLGLMVNQDRSIMEKMILFWHNHFATESNVYGNGKFGYAHYNNLRTHALGNFKQLVKVITLDTAMLNYLNGYLNTATAPDENYARELQELFTLGKENSPNYTEDDVKVASRVLTGWQINFNTDTVFFNINRHDRNNKTFSSFYGGATITGRTDPVTAGDTELDDLLNMIFNKQVEVSEFIIKKIYRWFCYYEIDPDTETNVIKPLAQLFRSSNWEIKPVLDTLLKSEHFYDILNYGALIKSPVEHLVFLCREFNIPFPAQSDYSKSYAMWNLLSYYAGIMQQNVFDPPSVAGWGAYYQAPQFYEIWINSDTLPKRTAFSDLLIYNGYTQNGFKLAIDPVAFTQSLNNPADPNALINETLDLLYRVPLSDQSKQTIKKQILLSNQDQDYYWTNAWNAYIGNPSDTMAYQTVYTRLRSFYRYLMSLAEYQLA